LYPPGSVAKPIILIAGMETRKITADEPISCPSQKAPQGWPNCWLLKLGRGHDDDWRSEGGNKARNAIKGSCNIYFSRVADRLEPEVLQRWLFAFGYGQKALPAPAGIAGTEYETNLMQAAGVISSSRPQSDAANAEQMPAILKSELRFFGIGQGSFRVSPLQVANAMAAISRGGVYAPAMLYLGANGAASVDLTPLGVSPATINVVRDGMNAVTSEYHGTAYDAFNNAGFEANGVRVYGKTGSTTGPEHAWFGGFAEDTRNRGVAIAVVVEGGQSGGHDAGPAAKEIIRFCIEAGYIGSGQPAVTAQEN
jgi:penicillin-binding protein 2